MIRHISMHRLATQEMWQAFDYYRGIDMAVADRFVAAFEAVLSRLRLFPESGPVVYRAVRHMLLDDFPYAIVYFPEADRIRIIAVSHTSRKPYYWRRRS